MLTLEGLQARLPIGKWGQVVEYYPSLPSTNNHAWKLAQEGAPHGTLVVANEQTAGKGRGQNRWFTPPDAALAMSFILRFEGQAQEYIGALNILGALAVVHALRRLGLEGQIKWPNDVLVEGFKVCGVLSEASWQDDQLEFAIVGIGVNVRPESVPPRDVVQWPAACLDTLMGEPIQRLELMVDIVRQMAGWYDRVGQPALNAAWEQCLAYKGQIVQLRKEEQVVEGRVEGLDADGSLVVDTGQGLVRMTSGVWQFDRVDRPEN